jgi:hypothetical protein
MIVVEDASTDVFGDGVASVLGELVRATSECIVVSDVGVVWCSIEV